MTEACHQQCTAVRAPIPDRLKANRLLSSLSKSEECNQLTGVYQHQRNSPCPNPEAETCPHLFFVLKTAIVSKLLRPSLNSAMSTCLCLGHLPASISCSATDSPCSLTRNRRRYSCTARTVQQAPLSKWRVRGLRYNGRLQSWTIRHLPWTVISLKRLRHHSDRLSTEHRHQIARNHYRQSRMQKRLFNL
jgi:hypothetical protein